MDDPVDQADDPYALMDGGDDAVNEVEVVNNESGQKPIYDLNTQFEIEQNNSELEQFINEDNYLVEEDQECGNDQSQDVFSQQFAADDMS